MTQEQDNRAADDVVPVIDEDLVRAKVVNALNATGKHLAHHVYPNGYNISFVRLRGEGRSSWELVVSSAHGCTTCAACPRTVPTPSSFV